jgi:stearoyl-CoA 9-desaturase NADPH oxidoreductase
MAERGAIPTAVPATGRRALRAMSSFFTPLLPDDYIEMINPLWTTQELRGRIERIDRETGDAATIVIKPGWKWPGHEPGQYLRVGFVVDGIHHWRAYSLTSDPDRSDGCISITPKLVDGGKVSPYLLQTAVPGTVVRLGGVEGTFVLPDPLPDALLFVTAGSGITPIMSMLRSLEHRGALDDVVLIHSARTPDDVIFGSELRGMAARHPGLRFHEQHTGQMGRMTPQSLDTLCPDWREREAFISGPGEMLDALTAHWPSERGDPARLHTERFQPMIGTGDGERGDGGPITFAGSGIEAFSDGGTPILVAGEEAGAILPYGCRMGICHTCVVRLCSGSVRDLRTGDVHGQDGEMVRTCTNAPEGPVVLELPNERSRNR